MISPSFAATVALTPPNLKDVLKRPLIVGASVSGDFLTQSPGKRLALRYTTADQIKVIAANGKPGREMLKFVDKDTLRDRTAIIGLDLFFWDSFAARPHETLKEIERLVKLAEEKKIDLVLGEVPEFVPHLQKSAAAINQKIAEVCAAHPRCHRLALHSILMKTLRDGYVLQDGKKVPVENLLPDGLHISAPASEFLAEEIKKAFETPAGV